MKKHSSGSVKVKRFAWILIVSILLIGVSACNGKKEKGSSDQSVKVATFFVKKAPIHQQIIISGKLESSEQTNLSFKIGGRVASVFNDVGDYVKKNSVMASLDQDEISANAAQAELMFQKMKRDYERVVQLHKEEAATKEQLQDMTTAYNNAEQQLKIAKYNLELSRIAAPFDGYVSMRRHDPGELIQAGDPVFIFVGKSSVLKVVSGVAGRYVGSVKQGTLVEITSDTVTDKVFRGRIKRIGMAADPATGTFPIEIEITDSTSLLRPGMVVSIEIIIGKAEDVIAIPPQALVEADEDRGYVFSFDAANRRVKKIAVKLGGVAGGMIIITDGLIGGTEIVSDGAEYLTGGEVVDKVGRKTDNDGNYPKGAKK